MSPTSQDARPSFGAARKRGLGLLVGAALIALALALRLDRLGWGLQHLPDYDERIFVEEALGMIARGDWDHRFYEYPGLLLWMLRILLEATGARGAEAYLVSRGLVAAFSTATVGLVFAVASAWVSRRAAIAAALLLAVSPIDVETAHMLRPDAVIAPLLLLAMVLAAPKEGAPRPGAAVLAATVATAIKFSAAIVFAPLALVLALRRTRPAAVLGLFAGSAVGFAILSPYTFLAGAASLAGMRTQVGYHYGEAEATGFVAMVGGFLGHTLPRALSWPGLLLCAWGLVAGWRGDRRRTLLWLSFPALWLIVFSTSGARYGRFLVPILGALCVVLAMGVEDLLRRSRPIAAGAGLVVAAGVALSATGTRWYLGELAGLTMDRALAEARGVPGARFIGSPVVDIAALSRDPREITPLPGFRGAETAATQFDVLILPADMEAPRGFHALARIAPTSAHSGPALAVHRAAARFEVTALDPAGATLRSSAPDREAQLRDGVASTRWRSEGSRGFIEIRFASVTTPARLELDFGASPPDRDYDVLLTDDRGPLDTLALRPPVGRQRGGAAFSQVVAWTGRPTRTLRVDLHGSPPLRVGEMRVFEEADLR